MSMFGYRRELSKYEDLDDDELLASLTAEELQELEKELSDIDPDGNVPIGLRQRDQTAKTPTGTFSREALMKYWENETRKLLEEERIGSASPRQKDENSREDAECMTDTEESEEEKEEAEENEKDNQEATRRQEEEEEEEESELEEPVTEEEEDEEDEEEDEEENSEPPVSSPPQHQPYLSSNGQSNPRPVEPAKRYSPLMCEPRVQVQESSRMSGNPTVVDDVLEKILNNDSDTIDVNLNNIENISQGTLIRFSEALRFNTHVRLFSLANTHADDQVAFAIAKMLRENCHITNLNLESNFITGKGILALVQALTQNRTLTELRFHNQRHICGGQVEMEIVKLLRENTTVIKLGYQFDLPGPRISMTTILTRNQDLKRQKRIQEQQQGGAATAANLRTAELQKTGISVSPYGSPRNLPWSSPKLPHVDMSKKNAPPPPPPPPPLPPAPQSEASSEKKAPTRTIAKLIKRQEASFKKENPNPPKSKTKKAKKGPGTKTKTDSILKELKNALKPIGDRENSRPSTPQRCAHDQLMAAIKGSSIRSLRKVEVPKYLQ